MSLRSISICVMLISLLFSAELADAQPDSVPGSSLHAAFDSNYIEDYTNSVTARLFLLFQNASLLINPDDNRISKIVYRPNVNVRIGIAGFWKWFGLGLSVNNPVFEPDDSKYGKTTTLDLRVNAFGRALAGELFLQKYRGYYINYPERPDGSHYIIPDMQTFAFGLSGYWIYNAGKFSIRAAFTQNERQKQSAGSLLVRPSFLYYRFSSDYGIIPDAIAGAYQIPSANLVKNGTFYCIGLSPGYAYTLVFLRQFYITAAAFPGVALQVSEYSNDSNHFSQSEFDFRLGGQVALGYNSEKWFLGGSIQTGFNGVPDQLNNTPFNFTVTQYRFWGGMRFGIFSRKSKSNLLK